jgi:hypothetical protein
MNARSCECYGLIEAGRWSEVEEHVERGFELARQLGARAWESNCLCHRAHILMSRGRMDEAVHSVLEAERIQEEMGSAAFTGGDVYAAMVLAAPAPPAARSPSRRDKRWREEGVWRTSGSACTAPRWMPSCLTVTGTRRGV